MELWISLTLLAVCIAGFLLAAKLLKSKPMIRRFTMLACLIFGSMLLLYSCLTGFLLAFAEPDPEIESVSGTVLSTQELPLDTLYLSLDDVDVENGTFYLTFTGLTEDLTTTTASRLPLSENLIASMLPGWDAHGKRYDFYTAKDFSLYWNYSEEQGFPAVGSLCRFQLNGNQIAELNEIDPAKLFAE